MATKNVNLVPAYHFDVFCRENDREDIKCGGPQTLGYDFYVDGRNYNNKKAFMAFIKAKLHEYGREYINVSVYRIPEFREDKLWTREKIEKCIKNINPAD